MKLVTFCIVVCFSTGVKQSGLYAAVNCVWEQMKVEQEVDVFHTVKHLRYHRPQIVQDMVKKYDHFNP